MKFIAAVQLLALGAISHGVIGAQAALDTEADVMAYCAARAKMTPCKKAKAICEWADDKCIPNTECKITNLRACALLTSEDYDCSVVGGKCVKDAVTKSPTSPPGLGNKDLEVLNYALTLEHLEAEFYAFGMKKFDAKDFSKYPTGTFAQFHAIAKHEAIHVETLIAVIDEAYPGKAVGVCEYNFGNPSVTQFVSIARALERTGVSAYLGRLKDVSSKAYLTAAGTITTVEARHASFLNFINGISGMPEAFDTPLDPASIVTIALPFIKSCPYDLGVTPNAALKATLNKTGKSVAVSYEGQTGAQWCKFLFGLHVVIEPVNEGSCVFPEDAKTDTYVFVIDANSANANVLAGPAVVSKVAEKPWGCN